MQNIEIHVLHVGNVRVSSNLPYGGESCSKLKAAGIFEKAEKRLWLPVSSYLIKHPKGLILVDTGWHREMSPEGTFDKKAQVKSLGTFPLYMVNQGIVKKGMTVDEQLETMGITPSDIDYVLVTHLDCDHANGLRQVCDAKNILVAKEELKSAARMHNKIRYNRAWWKGIEFTPFEWNGHLGPVNKSYDLFGDGSVQLINMQDMRMAFLQYRFLVIMETLFYCIQMGVIRTNRGKK